MGICSKRAPDGTSWLPVGEVPTNDGWWWAWNPENGVAEVVRVHQVARGLVFVTESASGVLEASELRAEDWRFAPVTDVADLRVRLAEAQRGRDSALQDVDALNRTLVELQAERRDEAVEKLEAMAAEAITARRIVELERDTAHAQLGAFKSREEAFMAGFAARQEAAELAANPHSPDAEEWVQWEMGWKCCDREYLNDNADALQARLVDAERERDTARAEAAEATRRAEEAEAGAAALLTAESRRRIVKRMSASIALGASAQLAAHSALAEASNAAPEGARALLAERDALRERNAVLTEALDRADAIIAKETRDGAL